MKEAAERKRVEILAPAGSYECMRAAINAGADAVYLGGAAFGARAYAGNFDTEELLRAIDFVHLHDKRLYLTVNTLLKERELNEKLYDYLKPYYEAGLDAVIVQDMGVLKFIREHFPKLDLHASTQMTITGKYGAELLKDMGASRVVTSRELSLPEVKEITSNVEIEIESFVHGALCYCYSGQCLLSSMIGGRSGNRGRCAQPCRLFYDTSIVGNDNLNLKNRYILSPKDICTLPILPEIIEAGVYSLKIEGRMKSSVYTASVVEKYRKYVDLYLEQGKASYKVSENDMNELMDIYNRGGFSEGYYKSYNGKNMMSIEKPNHMGTKALKVLENKKGKITFQAVEPIHQGDVFEISQGNSFTSGSNVEAGGLLVVNLPSKYNLKKHDILNRTKNKSLESDINAKYVETDKNVKIAGVLKLEQGESAEFTVGIFKAGKMTDSVTVKGAVAAPAEKHPATEDRILKQLRKTGGSGFEFEKLEVVIKGSVFVPIQELNELRRNALEQLKEKKYSLYRRKLPEIREVETRNKFNPKTERKQGVSVLVSTEEQLEAVLDDRIVETVYLDITLHDNGKNTCIGIEKCIQAGKKAFIRLPFILRASYEERLEQSVLMCLQKGADGFVIKNMDELGFMNRISEKSYRQFGLDIKLILDYNVYVFNSDAMLQYESCIGRHVSIIKYTVPVELNESELRHMNLNQFEMSVYGRTAVMVSAQCVRKTAGSCDRKNGVSIIRDRKNADFIVQSFCDYCYSVIYNTKALFLIDKIKQIESLGTAYVRLEFIDEGAAEVKNILKITRKFLQGTDASFRGDICCDIDWENNSDNIMADDMNENYTRGHFLRGVE